LWRSPERSAVGKRGGKWGSFRSSRDRDLPAQCDAIPVRWCSRAGAVGFFGTRKTFLET
jgi:hypothetical protein